MTWPLIQKHNLLGDQEFFDWARVRYFDARASNDPRQLEKFQEEVIQEMLTTENFRLLLQEQFWDLRYVPFILNGFKIFTPRINERELLQRTNLETYIYHSFSRVFNAIMERKLSIHCDSPISIPLDIAIQNPSMFIFKTLIQKVGALNDDMAILIDLVELIDCCVLENIGFCQKLSDILGIYTGDGRNPLKKPDGNEIRFLAIAQVLWFYNPAKNKSQIFNDDLWNEVGFSHYSKSTALEKLSVIDPEGSKRNPGRAKGSAAQPLESGLSIREIPGIVIGEGSQRRIDLEKAKILISSIAEALKVLKNTTSTDVKNHFLFDLYFKDADSMVERILVKQIKKQLREGLRSDEDLDLKDFLGVAPIVLQRIPDHIKPFRS
jgi:hypothetical protein